MKSPPRTPTPRMIAAAWTLIEEDKRKKGIRSLGPGFGVREIWEAMYDAAEGDDDCSSPTS